MFRESIDCIDAGSEYCPCHLAESGECLLCSQLQGCKFCDCLNWKGVCIYQELFDNENKAKKGRKTYQCKVIEKTLCENDVLLLKFESPHKLAIDLSKPGSYIFIRTEENVYFDVPISILESNIENNIISVMIEIRGVKTKKILEINVNDEMTIRGPYWNGVFGVKNIQKQKESSVVVLARGIGVAPMMPVIRKLVSNGNNVTLLLDKKPFKDIYVNELLEDYNVTPIEIGLINNKGELTDEAKVTLRSIIKFNNISLIHIAAGDILTYKVMDFLDDLDRKDIDLSCCNNMRMCCGEGICGSCTVKFDGDRIKRFCKTQADPRSIFSGRRFI